MFELQVDITPELAGRDYDKMMMTYPEGFMPKIISIEEIYEALEKGTYSNPRMPQVKGYNPYIKKGDIKKTRGIFRPKILLFLVDEMNELMTSDDYKSVDTIKQALGSIARLGRAAGVHLALAMQRASGGTVSTDLMNNIQQSILLGAFDSGSSTLMFEKDISNMAKPDIKGRAFMQVGKKDIYEVQTYWIEPENVWEFDENQQLTYENAVYLEQCKRRKKVPDDSGFVVPKKLSEEDIPVEEVEDINEEDLPTSEDFEDAIIEEKPKFSFSSKRKQKEDTSKEIIDLMNKTDDEDIQNDEDASTDNAHMAPSENSPIEPNLDSENLINIEGPEIITEDKTEQKTLKLNIKKADNNKSSNNFKVINRIIEK